MFLALQVVLILFVCSCCLFGPDKCLNVQTFELLWVRNVVFKLGHASQCTRLSQCFTAVRHELMVTTRFTPILSPSDVWLHCSALEIWVCQLLVLFCFCVVVLPFIFGSCFDSEPALNHSHEFMFMASIREHGDYTKGCRKISFELFNRFGTSSHVALNLCVNSMDLSALQNHKYIFLSAMHGPDPMTHYDSLLPKVPMDHLLTAQHLTST